MATSIDQLPNEMTQQKPTKVSNSSNNVQFEVKETSPDPRPPPQVPTELSKESINQIVQSLQESRNDTYLQNRDVPMDHQQFSHDEQVQPNFVPESNIEDYIDDEETIADLLKRQEVSQKSQSRLDKIYEELQTPILIMMLYFLFQIPYFKKLTLSKFPGLFLKSGDYNFGGYMLQTTLFGISYYAITKAVNYLTEV